MTYQIVVPSRRRLANMPRIRALLPDALIVVDEREAADYALAVPEDRLLIHPAFDGLPKVRNWIHDNVPANYLVHIDDDLRRVLAQVTVYGRKRVITSPDEIRRIIEAGVQVLTDLQAPAFCWGRSLNSVLRKPQLNTFSFTAPLGSAFIVRNGNRRWDENILSRSDLDYSLNVLLQERFILSDQRFYFDVGLVFRNPGGNTGLVSDERRKADTRKIMSRWGQYLELTENRLARRSKGRGCSDGLVVQVSRKSC